MKFKKAFAVILAVAMVITLMPTMAFASTTNTVSKVYKVAADEEMPTVQINMKVSGPDAVKGIFDLTLDNAEWSTEDPYTDIIDTSGTAGTINTGSSVQIVDENGGVVDATATTVDATSIRIDMGNANIATTDKYLKIYLNLKSGTETGDVKVTISDVNAGVSNQTLTVATVVDSNTVASVVGSTIKNVSSDGTYEGNQIKISETSVNAVADRDVYKRQLQHIMMVH